jgi:hypothetical protein
MDRQAAYNAGVLGVLKQGTPSLRRSEAYPPGICSYAGDAGTFCTIGHLIRPLYRADIEGMPAAHLPGWLCRSLGLQSPDDRAFLQGLQEVHDLAADIARREPADLVDRRFVREFRRLAARFASAWDLWPDASARSGA